MEKVKLGSNWGQLFECWDSDFEKAEELQVYAGQLIERKLVATQCQFLVYESDLVNRLFR